MVLLDGIRVRSDAEAYKSVSSVPSSVSPTVEYMGPLYLSWETVEASGRLPASLQCHIFVIRAQARRRPRGVDLRRRHSFTPRHRRFSTRGGPIRAGWNRTA